LVSSVLHHLFRLTVHAGVLRMLRYSTVRGAATASACHSPPYGSGSRERTACSRAHHSSSWQRWQEQLKPYPKASFSWRSAAGKSTSRYATVSGSPAAMSRAARSWSVPAAAGRASTAALEGAGSSRPGGGLVPAFLGVAQPRCRRPHVVRHPQLGFAPTVEYRMRFAAGRRALKATACMFACCARCADTPPLPSHPAASSGARRRPRGTGHPN